MSQHKMITISQKIELVVNDKAITHFRKAFGCARKAYNWAVANYLEYAKQKIYKKGTLLKKEFNAIKKVEFPYVYEVSKCVTQQPFIHFDTALERRKKAFEERKAGKKVKIPKLRFKKKSDNKGSFYLGNESFSLSYTNDINKKRNKVINGKKKKSQTQRGKKSKKFIHYSSTNKEQIYLYIANFGYIKMKEPIKYKGKFNNATITQKADKFYVSFSMEISEEEYNKHHKPVFHKNLGVGIDLGLKTFAVLSNGFGIEAPKPLAKSVKRLARLQRQLSRKQHPKAKGDTTKKSRNYLKGSRKLARKHKRIANIRDDFLHKTSTCLVRHCDYIYLENLNVKGMMKNRRLAKAFSDVSLSAFGRMIEYKASMMNKVVFKADRYYPSSKTCSCCGNVKENLTLKDRTYICEKCGAEIDRDLNASLNLYARLKENVGDVLAEFTPVDLTALQSDLAINRLATSEVSQKWIENEAGIQQELSN